MASFSCSTISKPGNWHEYNTVNYTINFIQFLPVVSCTHLSTSPSYLKVIFTGYWTSTLAVFSFITFKMLLWLVLFLMRNLLTFFVLPHVTFLWLLLRIFSLLPVLNNLILMCFYVVFFLFLVLGFLGFVGFNLYQIWEKKFSHYFFKCFLVSPHSLSVLWRLQLHTYEVT